jgi:1-acyl-sn-glycerol-3-phosphate acyltransferase
MVGVRLLGRGVFGFRTEVVGTQLLPVDQAGRPTGGWIAAGLPHRTWVDPFVVADNLPLEPRLVFFGDGRAIFRSRWRRLVFRTIGGVIPIWPGGGRAAVEAHLTAASAALSAGAVLCLSPRAGRRRHRVPLDHLVSASPTSRCEPARQSS